MSHDEKYYDLNKTEDYLKKQETIKMKRFYGKHLDKYTGNLQPETTMGETGVFGKYAPLSMTGFTDQPDWKTKTQSRWAST